MRTVQLKWVKLNKYCELTGETPDAVHSRRTKGIWLDGKHCRVAGDRRLWVNLEEAQRWAETSRVA